MLLSMAGPVSYGAGFFLNERPKSQIYGVDLDGRFKSFQDSVNKFI